ncbi:putative phosphoglucosamine mutase [uncultured archaeon]|nr:putative phosphoglucosamine mutase [uncultured archaeon]
MTERLFGTSGIRRKVTEFPPDFAKKLGQAVGTITQDQEVAVGRDTRASGPTLMKEAVEGLASTGRIVVDCGMVPTPTLGVAAARYGTAVMVTASHNPGDYNGFKVFNHKGAFSPIEEDEVQRVLEDGRFKKGKVRPIRKEDFIEEHIQLILKRVPKADGVRVLLDCAGGAGSAVTPKLLEQMGCEVTVINDNTDGKFPHPLEPTAENLAQTSRKMIDGNYDVGFAHDGDADRTACLSSDGRLVEWDSFLAALAYEMDVVVTTVDASMRIEDVAKKVIRTKVGDVAVADAIRKNGAQFGGEPSGSFIFPDIHYYPDGPAAAAKAAAMAAEGRLYDALARIRSYPMARLKLPCVEAKKSKVMEKLPSVLSEKYSTVDGVRIERADGWVLVRPSGTEPFMRITAEGRTQEALDKMVYDARGWLKKAGL